MILIYSHKITERLRYTMELLLNNLLGITFELTDKKDQFTAFDGEKFSYADKPFGDELFFYATPLLFERSIKNQNISVFPFEDTIGFYRTGANSALPFDVFAASFFMASRYEEYLPFIKDAHHRFPPEQSLAYKEGFIEKPVVNIWSRKLMNILSKHFPNLQFRKHQYRFTPTYDIDMAWSYRNKGLVRSVGGISRSLKNFDFKEISDRAFSLLRMKDDPFYTFDYMHSLDEKYHLKPLYFIIVGDYDQYDKNIPVTNAAFQNLIMDIADYAEIGLHPSYASNYNKKKLVKEKERLEDVLKRHITKSRQHYLILEFPRTYQNIIDLDITDDYTLGYTSQLGFRAGMCTSFYFYNLHLELKTKLNLHPFGIMDATLQYYQQRKPEEALEASMKIIDEVKAVNGHLMTLWHNNSFSEEREWIGWRSAYESIVEYALPS